MSDKESSDSGRSDNDEKFSDATDLPPEGTGNSTDEIQDDKATENAKGDREMVDSERTVDGSKNVTFQETLEGPKETKTNSINIEEIKQKFMPVDDGKCHLCKYFYTIGDETLLVHGMK